MNRYGSGSLIRWGSLALVCLRLEQVPSQAVQEDTDDPALVRRQIPMDLPADQAHAQATQPGLHIWQFWALRSHWRSVQVWSRPRPLWTLLIHIWSSRQYAKRINFLVPILRLNFPKLTSTWRISVMSFLLSHNDASFCCSRHGASLHTLICIRIRPVVTLPPPNQEPMFEHVSASDG